MSKAYWMGPEGLMEMEDGVSKPVAKKTGEFFNTHVEGFKVGAPPIMARIFGKRVSGEDGGYRCSGVMWKGVMYITEMRPMARWVVVIKSIDTISGKVDILKRESFRWRWAAQLHAFMVNTGPRFGCFVIFTAEVVDNVGQKNH